MIKILTNKWNLDKKFVRKSIAKSEIDRSEEEEEKKSDSPFRMPDLPAPESRWQKNLSFVTMLKGSWKRWLNGLEEYNKNSDESSGSKHSSS